MKNVRYNRGDEIVEVTIRDTSGARIEVRRSNLTDEKENGKWLMWLVHKWGLRFKINKENIDFLDMENDFLKI